MSNYHYEMTSMQVDETLFYRRSDTIQRLRFLLKYAVMAPSAHNTQPWLFRVQHDEIWIYADSSHWLRIADADKRQLHISLGGCLENLLVAAEYYNYSYQVRYFPSATQPDLIAIVSLHAEKDVSKTREAAMLQAISKRRTAMGMFRKIPVESLHWQLLESCCADGIEVIASLRSPRMTNKLAELTGLADQVLYSDRAYRDELVKCVKARLYGESSLAVFLKQWSMRRKAFANRNMKQHQKLILTSPGIAILCGADNHALMQVKCGQVLQRMALIGTTVGLAIQPFNQVLEIPEIRDELLNDMGKKSLQPLCIFRVGYKKNKLKATPRRPLEDVLI